MIAEPYGQPSEKETAPNEEAMGLSSGAEGDPSRWRIRLIGQEPRLEGLSDGEVNGSGRIVRAHDPGRQQGLNERKHFIALFKRILDFSPD